MDYGFVSPRGGSGKTTLALTFAACLAREGRRVLLVDDDTSAGAALVFAAVARRAGRVLPFVISPAASSGFDDVIYDCSPGVVGRADELPGEILFMPTLCDQASHVLLYQALEDLKQVRRTAIVIPNRARLDRADQRALIEAEFGGQAVIRDRAAMAATLARGLTIYDPELGGPWIGHARTEFEAAFAPVLTAAAGATEQPTARRRAA